MQSNPSFNAYTSNVQLRQPRMLCCNCLPPGSFAACTGLGVGGWGGGGGGGHLGGFQRDISHLTWHEIVCMRYLTCTFSQMKSINMFSMFFCNLEFTDISFEHLLRFEHRTSLFSCLCMSILTPNSSGNMQKHGCFGMFSFCVHKGKYIWGLGHSVRKMFDF